MSMVELIQSCVFAILPTDNGVARLSAARADHKSGTLSNPSNLLTRIYERRSWFVFIKGI